MEASVSRWFCFQLTPSRAHLLFSYKTTQRKRFRFGPWTGIARQRLVSYKIRTCRTRGPFSKRGTDYIIHCVFSEIGSMRWHAMQRLPFGAGTLFEDECIIFVFFVSLPLSNVSFRKTMK